MLVGASALESLIVASALLGGVPFAVFPQRDHDLIDGVVGEGEFEVLEGDFHLLHYAIAT